MADWQGFYSTAQVSRIVRVPRRTLYEWKRKGIVSPSVHILDEHGKPVDEGYSYADLAIIKLMRGLRTKELNLRSVAIALRHLFDRLGPFNTPAWTNAHLYVVGKEVFAQKPDDWETTVATSHGQKVETRVIGELVEEEGRILVPKDFGQYIEINPRIMEGQPVIRDSRVPTAMIAALHHQGTSISELVELYKPLTRVQIRKAIEYERGLDTSLAGTPS